MKKILVIPSHFVDPKKMKVRIIEIAKGMTSRYEVYLLSWHAELSGGFLKRLWSCVLDLFRKKRLYKSDSFIMIELPILHRPLSLAIKLNSFFLNKFIELENIEIVMSGSYHMFEIPEKRKFKYVYDLADLPAPGCDSYFDRFIHKHTGIEAGKADEITVVSKSLAKYVSEKYNRQAQFVPNGAYINELRSLNEEKIKEIRQKYNLIDKWIIGYIGLIGSWVAVEFLVNVFYQIKKDINNVALFFVGASPDLKKLRNKFSEENIIFTGTIEGEIADYFNCIDIGILPHIKNLYQDLAFHIKLIEYTSARKIVVSTPLEGVKNINFPNILLADLNLSEWVQAIKNAKEMKWSNEWDRMVEPFDWKNIFNTYFGIIESLN